MASSSDSCTSFKTPCSAFKTKPQTSPGSPGASPDSGPRTVLPEEEWTRAYVVAELASWGLVDRGSKRRLEVLERYLSQLLAAEESESGYWVVRAA